MGWVRQEVDYTGQEETRQSRKEGVELTCGGVEPAVPASLSYQGIKDYVTHDVDE